MLESLTAGYGKLEDIEDAPCQLPPLCREYLRLHES